MSLNQQCTLINLWGCWKNVRVFIRYEYPFLPSSLVPCLSRYLPALPLSSHRRSLQHSFCATIQDLASFPLFPFSSPVRLLPLSFNVNQVTNDKNSNDLLPRYRTKCKRLEREAEQGLSAHPQEPLVCDTSCSTSLCVLVLCLVWWQHVLTHLNLNLVFL